MKQGDQNTKPAYVYLMSCEGFIKIGVAVDPWWRRVAIQTGNPFEVSMVGTRLFPTFAEATVCEWNLHQDFAAKQHRGEWFTVTTDEAKAALAGFSLEVPPKRRRRGDPLPVTKMAFKGEPERPATPEEAAMILGG